ncbi:MAG: rod shape-determining protein MreD [Verrucomicrobia bacterium]|nr:rod shape-determining protein MreD [Verrucomicrobiota bacterium]
MTWVIMFFAGVGAAFVQAHFPAPMLLGQVKWPLLIGVVLYYALQREPEDMLVAAAFTGFLQDALSPAPLGMSAVVFACIGWCVARFRALVVSDTVITQAFFGLVGAGIAALALYVLMRVGGLLGLPLGQGIHKIVGSAVEGALATPLVFMVVGKLDRMVGNTRTAKEVEGAGSELDGVAE